VYYIEKEGGNEMPSVIGKKKSSSLGMGCKIVKTFFLNSFHMRGRDKMWN
jgi:hypothetical protein